MLQSDFCQKSQSSHIHTEDRNTSFTGKASGIQHRAVAPQHQKYIGAAGQLSFLKTAFLTEERGRGGIEDDVDIPIPQP